MKSLSNTSKSGSNKNTEKKDDFLLTDLWRKNASRAGFKPCQKETRAKCQQKGMQEKSTRDAKCGCLLMERDNKIEIRKVSPQMLRTAPQSEECCCLWIRILQSAKNNVWRKSVKNARTASDTMNLMQFVDAIL